MLTSTKRQTVNHAKLNAAARALINARMVSADPTRRDTWVVPSSIEGYVPYVVTLSASGDALDNGHSCTCPWGARFGYTRQDSPDTMRAKGQGTGCKHIRAALMLRGRLA
jgi:hypothetical protein